MSESITILLVEDNQADVELTTESLENSKLHLKIHTVTDGAEALEFLLARGRHTNAPRPDLVLLDLNLPRLDGRDVLAAIKQDDNLRRIPVVILTSSDFEIDVIKSYDLGANCYIKKPVGLPEFETIVTAIENFWFTVVKLPER
ncbi:MAG: response regulator [Gammaproteobacteria bacterium]|nr:response regulator [Gammaproteobacteria bacterium]